MCASANCLKIVTKVMMASTGTPPCISITPRRRENIVRIATQESKDRQCTEAKRGQFL